MLNKEQIEAATMPPAGTLTVAELGGDVGIRLLPASEVRMIREWDDDGFLYAARFAALVLCDANGKRLFSDEEAVKLEALPMAVLLKIGNRASTLNLLTDESREALRKNSQAAG